VIRDRGVALRYAHALFGAAVQGREAEPVLADLESLEQLYERNRAFQDMLDAPYVLTEDKMAMVERILGGRVSDLVVRFLFLMLRKKRVQHLPLVFEHYRRLVEEHLGIERVRVTTAVPLPEDLAGELRTRLERITGRRVRLEPRVDPAILGGAVVTFAGRIIDGSLRHRLDEMREQLRSARVV
jgi:F-type H+-transporting ATPase subunit delta